MRAFERRDAQDEGAGNRPGEGEEQGAAVPPVAWQKRSGNGLEHRERIGGGEAQDDRDVIEERLLLFAQVARGAIEVLGTPE